MRSEDAGGGQHLGKCELAAEGVIAKRIGKNQVGFGADIKSRKSVESTELLSSVMPEDLLSYGLIPEFIGRLPVVSAVHQLTREDLDRLDTTRPVLLRNADGHKFWLNSRAIENLSVDERTPVPSGGQIGRDAQGRPNGFFADMEVEDCGDVAPVQVELQGRRGRHGDRGEAMGRIIEVDRGPPAPGVEAAEHAIQLQVGELARVGEAAGELGDAVAESAESPDHGDPERTQGVEVDRAALGRPDQLR